MCQKQSRKQRKGRKRYYSCLTAAEEKHGDCEILEVTQNCVQLKWGKESDPHSCALHPLSPLISPCLAGLVTFWDIWRCSRVGAGGGIKSLGMGPRQTPHQSQCPCTLLRYLYSHICAHPLFRPKKDKFEQ